MSSVSDQVFQIVLSMVNKEQNQHYPVRIFEAHYLLATHWLLDTASAQYPGPQVIQDLIAPYMKTKLVRVTNGSFAFPDTYRNLLGYGVPYQGRYDIPKDWCGGKVSEAEIEKQIAEKRANTKTLDNVSVGRWNSLVNHRYKQPKLENGIACTFSSEEIRVCPFDIPFVEVRYTVKVEPFKYGYTMNPDETYYFDPAKTKEALWKENAIEYLVKAINILYGIYAKDPEHSVSAKDLRDVGLF